MEFVLISSNIANTHAKTIEQALASAPRMASVDGPLRLYNFGGLMLAASGTQKTPKEGEEEENNIILWDGHGVTRTQAFSSGTDASLDETSANNYINSCLKGEKTDTRGVFTAVRVNVNSKAFTATIDPLSQYPLFIYQFGHSLIIGNSIYLVEAAARGIGLPVTRSTRSGAFEAAFGVGAGLETGIKEIKLLPNGRAVTGIGVNSRLVPVSGMNAYAHTPYEELLELAADRLSEYMSLLKFTTARSDLIFDLTGGLDSRITLAAAINAGIKDLKIFSGGSDQSADKQIAYQIGDRYNARAVNFPENHAGAQHTSQTMARRAIYRSQGSSNLYAYSLGTQRLGGTFRVRGGAGEITRSFIDPPGKSLFWHKPLSGLGKFSRGEPVFSTCIGAHWRGVSDERLRHAALWAHAYCNSPASHHQLYRARFLREGTSSVIDGLMTRARTTHSMGMDFYMRDRARRHFGFMSRGLNMAYGAFEPLMDPVIMAAANALPSEERAAGKLTFDLIEKLAGKSLLKIPFGPSSLSAVMQTALARRLDVKEKTLKFKPGKLTELKKARIFSAKAPNIQYTEKPPADLGKWAQSLWHNRYYFETLAGSIPRDNDYWQYLDRNVFLKTLKSNSYFMNNETTAMRGIRLMHTLIWMAGEEDATSIKTVI
ncbi:hypothetical protein [Kordiimonas aquimaris]|uniref:hypothetical protein n=1 Tax=Kordiimonas aquimaris TaxID=707591 RepID=UPI0021D08F6E|nr:hypothetical protein [Kordiimonas aquimaris]